MTTAAKTRIAPRQPRALSSAQAAGKETEPAKPATKVTSVIALRAALPIVVVMMAKVAS